MNPVLQAALNFYDAGVSVVLAENLRPMEYVYA
jgi:hypothetical protein